MGILLILQKVAPFGYVSSILHAFFKVRQHFPIFHDFCTVNIFFLDVVTLDTLGLSLVIDKRVDLRDCQRGAHSYKFMRIIYYSSAIIDKVVNYLPKRIIITDRPSAYGVCGDSLEEL